MPTQGQRPCDLADEEVLSLLEELARKQEDVSLHLQSGPGASANLGSRPSPASDGAQRGAVISGTAGHLGVPMELVIPGMSPHQRRARPGKTQKEGANGWIWDLNPSSALHLLRELRPVR